MDVIDILMARMLSGGGVDPEQISSAVTDWLDENVDPVGSAVVVDSSLSIEGAAADAAAVGAAIRDARLYLEISDETYELALSGEGSGTDPTEAINAINAI